MASTQAVQSAWSAYRASVETLLEESSNDAVETTESRTVRQAEEAETVVTRSARVREMLEEDLESGDLSVRRRNSLALMDLAIANLGTASRLLPPEPHRGVLSVQADAVVLSEQLFPTPWDGDDRPADGELSGLERREARERLEKAMTAMLSDVPQRAADLGLSIIGDATVGAVAQAIGGSAGATGRAILARLPEGVALALRAAKGFIVEAFKAILAAIGPTAAERVRTWITERFDEFKKNEERAAEWLLHVYGGDRLQGETVGVVRAIPQSVETVQLVEALKEVEGLKKSYDADADRLDKILGRTRFLQGALLLPLAQPWGPLLLAGIYVAAFGYNLYAGGDHLDWFVEDHIGWIDRTDGLRGIANQVRRG